MATYKCKKCGVEKESRCKPKKCTDCGDAGEMVKVKASPKSGKGCGCSCSCSR